MNMRNHAKIDRMYEAVKISNLVSEADQVTFLIRKFSKYLKIAKRCGNFQPFPSYTFFHFQQILKKSKYTSQVVPGSGVLIWIFMSNQLLSTRIS